MRAPTADEFDADVRRRRDRRRSAATSGHGGKRRGAGRPKGSTKLLPEQEFDLFSDIEERCAQREGPHRFGRRRFVRRVCKWIAKNVSFRWVRCRAGDIDTFVKATHGEGETVATTDHYSARRFENIYYAVKRRFRDAGVELEYNTEPWLNMFDERGYSLISSGPADWPEPGPGRTTVMIVERRRSGSTRPANRPPRARGRAASLSK
jgi:hypothetical protein